MPITAVYLRHRRPVDYGTTPGTTTITRRGRELFRRYANVALGSLADSYGDGEYTFVDSGSVEPAFASAILDLSSTSTGSVGATINGVAVTATYATSPLNTAGLVAAAINASSNALVKGLVQASNLGCTLTLTSVAAGDTVTILGSRFVATSGTPATIVTGGNLFSFDCSGSDSADATALAAAINTAPGLSLLVCAYADSNAVYVMSRTATYPAGPGVPANVVASQASTIVASAASLTAIAYVGITACVPGVTGNTQTIAASGTGAAIVGSLTRLAGGQALGLAPIVDQL